MAANSRDLAHEIGTSELTMNDKGKPTTVVGKFLVASKKQKNC